MSGAENFLARWSRRKRQAAQRPTQPESSPAAPEMPAAEAPAPDSPLPPIESITAATDLKPFLTSGVPASLARAALRRAWTADPAIRDFVGLAENAWDFNAQDGVPGFGSLTVEDVRRLVAELAREPDPVEPAPAPPTPVPASAAEPEPAPAVSNAAVQHEAVQQNPAPLPSNRRHGGALPQ
jgi:Protein of unknown function (DUF3306)